MNDCCVDCNRKAYCLEPCEQWLIQHDKCPVCQNNLSVLAAAQSVSLEIGRSVVNMKILMKPIEMIAWFSLEGVPNPVRYKLDDKVIKIEQVTSKSEEKLAGNRMIIFRCQSEMNGELRPFELKYELQTCRWFLFKM